MPLLFDTPLPGVRHLTLNRVERCDARCGDHRERGDG
jgi:hypothetical protein